MCPTVLGGTWDDFGGTQTNSLNFNRYIPISYVTLRKLPKLFVPQVSHVKWRVRMPPYWAAGRIDWRITVFSALCVTQ